MLCLTHVTFYGYVRLCSKVAFYIRILIGIPQPDIYDGSMFVKDLNLLAAFSTYLVTQQSRVSPMCSEGYRSSYIGSLSPIIIRHAARAQGPQSLKTRRDRVLRRRLIKPYIDD